MGEAGKQAEVNSNIKSELAILYQRKLRYDNNIVGQEKELIDLQRSIQNLRGEMQRMNGLIAQANTQEESLDSLNRRTAEEFQNRLVALEAGCVSIEQSVDGVKAEKEQLLVDISEAEKQIMLIERKIQPAKETIEALDPNVGRAENTKMKQEIHRMELRHVQLKTKQMGKAAQQGGTGAVKQSIGGLSRKVEDSTA